MSTAQSTVHDDNDRVRMTTWSFAGHGAATGMHRHELDYIVVPVTGGAFTVVDEDGSTRELRQVAGEPYQRPAGATHDVVSADGPAVFVEIELKR